MKENKLLRLFKILEESEVKGLGKFLKGTSHTPNGGVFALYNYYRKYHPVFSEKKMDKSIICKVVCNRKDDFKRLDDLNSQLYKVIEDFLVFKNLEENHTQKQLILLKVLRQKKEVHLFGQKVEALKRFWEKNPQSGIEQLYNECKLAEIYHMSPIQKPVELQHLNVIEKMDKYYFIHKLYWTLSYLYSNKSFASNKNKAKTMFLEKELIEYANMPPFQDFPQVKLLGQLLKDFKESNFQNYHAIKQAFINTLHLYNPVEKHDILQFVLNFCDMRYQKGIANGPHELFELNQLSVRHRLIFNKNRINPEIFKNIVRIGCAANEIKWTEDFVNDFGKQIRDEQEDTVRLCEAIIAMCKKNYDEVLYKTSIAPFNHITDKLQIRLLKLKCYYELEEVWPFKDLIISFKRFLTNSTILSASNKNAIINFIDFTRELFVLKRRKFREEEQKEKVVILKKLKNKISLESAMIEKSWLNQKLEEEIKKGSTI